ncbi:MAG: molybdopterin-guanine dinucleotide biosynthesis protein B [Candidatus Bathyarchaeia archaeon]|nr:molybdopterin-guanine dinucleotide biosynthesis protein B [Candidatus Bathyarchaeota archaeon]
MSRWTGLTVCIIGYGKGSGKTKVIEELTKILVSRGYSVATVKHCSHPIDVIGKDTYRHRAAGARASLAISRGEVALFLPNTGDSVEEYMDLLPSTSFTLIEGFKEANYPKILCIPDGYTSCNTVFKDLLAVVVCKKGVDIHGINVDKPVFSIDDLNLLAKMLVDEALDRITRILGGSDCGRCGFTDCRSFALAILRGEVEPYICTLSRGSRVEVFFDGKPIQLNRFTENIVSSTLKGMLSCLKGLEELTRSNVRFKIEISSMQYHQ